MATELRTFEDMVNEVHTRTGLTGKDLELATLLVALKMAEFVRNVEAANHYRRRLKEVVESENRGTP